MMSTAPTPSQPTDAPAHRGGWGKIILLLLLIAVLAFIVYFVSLTRNISQQLTTGTYDLSAFATDGQSQYGAASTAPPPTIVDPRVSNYANDPSIGPLDAPITIIAFEDFQCPYCGAAWPHIKTLINKHGDQVRLIYRDFPIASIHPDANNAAQAGACAHEQGQFWPYHDRLYQNQDRLSVPDLKRYAEELNFDTGLFDDCLDTGKYASEVDEDFQDGVAAGVAGTPTFFINGNVVSGVINEAGFDQIVDYFGN